AFSRRSTPDWPQNRDRRRGLAMAEVDFATASVAEIAAAYFDSGSILLRNFANVARLRALVAFVDELYGQIDEAHIFPHHLKARSLPQFHEYIFEAKHHALLREI